MHAFDRQTDGRTDGQTEFSSLDRVCHPCSAVKKWRQLSYDGWSCFSVFRRSFAHKRKHFARYHSAALVDHCRQTLADASHAIDVKLRQLHRAVNLLDFLYMLCVMLTVVCLQSEYTITIAESYRII